MLVFYQIFFTLIYFQKTDFCCCVYIHMHVRVSSLDINTQILTDIRHNAHALKTYQHCKILSLFCQKVLADFAGNKPNSGMVSMRKSCEISQIFVCQKLLSDVTFLHVNS